LHCEDLGYVTQADQVRARENPPGSNGCHRLATQNLGRPLGAPRDRSGSECLTSDVSRARVAPRAHTLSP